MTEPVASRRNRQTAADRYWREKQEECRNCWITPVTFLLVIVVAMSVF